MNTIDDGNSEVNTHDNKHFVMDRMPGLKDTESDMMFHQHARNKVRIASPTIGRTNLRIHGVTGLDVLWLNRSRVDSEVV